jgi:hypothetical protein
MTANVIMVKSFQASEVSRPATAVPVVEMPVRSSSAVSLLTERISPGTNPLSAGIGARIMERASI